MSTEKLDEAARLKAAYERNEFLNLHEIVAKARQNLNQNAWDYIVGGVETETTLRRNRMALDTVAFRPRVLRDVSKVDASTELLGRKLRLPIVLCSGRHAGKLPPRGRRAGRQGGRRIRHRPYAELGVRSRPRRRRRGGARRVSRMFQLYVRGDAAWVDDHVAAPSPTSTACSV